MTIRQQIVVLQDVISQLEAIEKVDPNLDVKIEIFDMRDGKLLRSMYGASVSVEHRVVKSAVVRIGKADRA